jgi:hypothetical protein
MYKRESENVKGRYKCVLPEELQKIQPNFRIPNNKQACEVGDTKSKLLCTLHKIVNDPFEKWPTLIYKFAKYNLPRRINYFHPKEDI